MASQLFAGGRPRESCFGKTPAIGADPKDVAVKFGRGRKGLGSFDWLWLGFLSATRGVADPGDALVVGRCDWFATVPRVSKGCYPWRLVLPMIHSLDGTKHHPFVTSGRIAFFGLNCLLWISSSLNLNLSFQASAASHLHSGKTGFGRGV